MGKTYDNLAAHLFVAKNNDFANQYVNATNEINGHACSSVCVCSLVPRAH